MKACAGRRQGRWHVTWITPRIKRAYAALYDEGYVHSFEVWNATGPLVGGGYGVALGRILLRRVAILSRRQHLQTRLLCSQLASRALGLVLNDAKNPSPTILDMDFRSIPRTKFLRCLAENAGSGGKAGYWEVEADPKAVADWQPGADLLAAK